MKVRRIEDEKHDKPPNHTNPTNSIYDTHRIVLHTSHHITHTDFFSISFISLYTHSSFLHLPFDYTHRLLLYIFHFTIHTDFFSISYIFVYTHSCWYLSVKLIHMIYKLHTINTMHSIHTIHTIHTTHTTHAMLTIHTIHTVHTIHTMQQRAKTSWTPH